MPWPSHCPTRGSCPTRSSNRSDCVPFAGCELGYSEIEVAELLGLSRETVSRWWTAYVDHAWKLSQATAPAARSAPVVPSTTGKRHGCGRSSRKKPRGGGDRLPVVDPQGRRRVDPQGVRDRHAGADRRRVPRAVGLHCQGAAPSCQGSGPRGGPPLAGGHLSGDRARAAREDAEIHWCDETGAVADQQPRRGYAREGRPAKIEVPHPTSA